MDSPNSTTNRNSGSQLATEWTLVKPRNDCPQPHWNSATMTPYAAPTDSRLSMTAVNGMTRERNETSSSRNASSRTKAKTQADRCPMSVLKSTEPAVSPVTATWTPGTLPSVAGMTCSRRVVRACTDVASPLPASGTEMIAAVCAGLTMNVIGWFISPVASAARSNAAPAAATEGDVTSGASTTTTAGVPPPGNTC